MFYLLYNIVTYIFKLHDLIYNSDKLLKWAFFLGDNAFSAAFYILVPDFDIGNFDNYNFEHSLSRMHIECAFGILVNK